MNKGDVKQRTYAKERAFLSEYACLSEHTRGRERPEKACDMRTDFQRDRDRIIYSKAFLRLKNKTQVFFSPEGDHFRTRMTHTIDVSQIARSIARSLALNEDLAQKPGKQFFIAYPAAVFFPSGSLSIFRFVPRYMASMMASL